jgi:hypothetical protein
MTTSSKIAFASSDKTALSVAKLTPVNDKTTSPFNKQPFGLTIVPSGVPKHLSA